MLSSSSTIRRIAGSAISSLRLRPGALGRRDVARAVLRLPGEAFAQRVPFDLIAEALDGGALAGLPGALAELHDAAAEAAARARAAAGPKAAVDLPLPLPVWTISRPFSMVLAATSASCAALRLAILALWRASSSVSAGHALHNASEPSRQPNPVVIKAFGQPYQAGDGAPHGDQKGTRCNAAAAPATVVGKPIGQEYHWETGKVAKGEDPRARKPAVGEPSHWRGEPPNESRIVCRHCSFASLVAARVTSRSRAPARVSMRR